MRRRLVGLIGVSLSAAAAGTSSADLSAYDAKGKSLGIVTDHNGIHVDVWNLALTASMRIELASGYLKPGHGLLRRPELLGSGLPRTGRPGRGGRERDALRRARSPHA